MTSPAPAPPTPVVLMPMAVVCGVLALWLGRNDLLDLATLPAAALAGLAFAVALRRPGLALWLLVFAWAIVTVAAARAAMGRAEGSDLSVLGLQLARTFARVVVPVALGLTGWLALRAARLPPATARTAGAVLLAVMGPWWLLHGWYAGPCLRGATQSCSRWIDAELDRGTVFIARAAARAVADPAGGSTAVFYRIGTKGKDPRWVERIMGPFCSRASRSACVSLGDMWRDLEQWDEAIAWWDKACDPVPPGPGEARNNCLHGDDHLPRLIAAGRWPDVERYLENQCRGALPARNCPKEVPMGVLDRALAHDRPWGEQAFTARCQQGLARWCFVRGSFAERGGRPGDDPRPWYRRACDLGDDDGCRAMGPAATSRQ